MTEQGRPTKRWWEWILDSVAFEVITTFLLVSTGFFSSVLSDELQQSLTWPWRWSWKLDVFVLACLADIGFLFLLVKRNRRQRVTEVERLQGSTNNLEGVVRDEVSRLEESTKKLEDVVRTQPPPDFLGTFAGTYESTEIGAAPVHLIESGLLTREDTCIGVRHALTGLAILARKIDGRAESGVTYGANVMLYRPLGFYSAKERADLTKRAVFEEAAICDSPIAGVLELDKDLSSTSATDDPERDESLFEGLALGVHKKPYKTHGTNPRLFDSREDAGDDVLYCVLPGAPVAFVDTEPDLYSNTRGLARWCKDHGGFPKDVRDRIEHYFGVGGPGESIRSFLSVPLWRADDIERDFKPLGVLNIHASVSGIMHDDKARLEQFLWVTHPFQVMISRLLDTYPQVQDIKRWGDEHGGLRRRREEGDSTPV